MIPILENRSNIIKNNKYQKPLRTKLPKFEQNLRNFEITCSSLRKNGQFFKDYLYFEIPY